MTRESLVRRVADRMAYLARPPRLESPFGAGAPLAAWATAAGVGADPHELLAKSKPLPPEPYAPEDVAREALGRLVARCVVEPCTRGYRPVPAG